MADRSTILLFSLDMLGSTAYKAKHPFTGRTPGWVEALEDFFSLSIQTVLGRTSLDFMDRARLPNVRVHKTKGDELLFIATPSTLDEIADLVRMFLAATVEVEKGLQQRWGLSVHATIWMASLIGKNRAIRIPELDANGSQYYEYVGPEVDIGFRLGKHAPAGRVIVPYELPILLEDYGLKFEQIGEASLQGVSVNPYPLWLVVE
jgi:hypothetical protein